MKREYCLDIDGNVYTLGDLNMFLNNKEPISYPAVDSQNPTKPFFTGSIRQGVEIDGIARSFLLYIPQHYPISGAGIFLYPDDDVSAEDYLENSGWKPVAEQTNAALIVLESRSGGWDKKDVQSEISYSEAVFKKSIARVYFSMNEATYYCMGFGNGAYVAAAYAMLNSALIAAVALDGDYDLHPDLMAQLRSIRSDREANKSKLDVAMPAWLIGKATPLLDSLKRAADASDEQLYNDAAYIYRQNLKQYFDQPNGLPMVEIWHTEPGRWNPEADEKYRRMAEFALRFKRWLSIPEDMVEQAEEYRNILVEAVAENDEELMEKYLEGEEITREELKKAIRKETIANTLVPVVCGSSYKNRGVQKLLDAIVDYMPAPTDVEDIKGVNPETEEQETRPSSDDAPFAALAFKIATMDSNTSLVHQHFDGIDFIVGALTKKKTAQGFVISA